MAPRAGIDGLAALVTGGGSGIGLGAAIRLVRTAPT
jgi:NAD(P)-dependent dehydrogenase (short-subunit alcohol dehydrogenase family)